MGQSLGEIPSNGSPVSRRLSNTQKSRDDPCCTGYGLTVRGHESVPRVDVTIPLDGTMMSTFLLTLLFEKIFSNFSMIGKATSSQIRRLHMTPLSMHEEKFDSIIVIQADYPGKIF